jgi:D-alanyl-D-alanine carboxypeptidase (penicillin-binding protein 5/6)
MSRRRSGAALLAALLALLVLLPAGAGAEQPAPEARAWTLIDARSGAVLDSHAAARSLPIASTTKLMTAYVALQELSPKRIVRTAPYEPIYGESLLGVPSGRRISIHDLLYGLLLRSGNDSAHDLALAAAGSQARFVAQMNQRAAALGLADTHYANPIGLDQRGNYSSARDLATLTRRLLRIPTFAKIVDARTAVLHSLRPPRRIANSNDLLRMVPWATGVKTGHTFDAGYVLVASGSRDGVDLISVAIGAPTEEARYSDNLELLEYGFSRYKRRVPIHAGQDLADPEIRFSGGELPLRAARGVEVGLRRGERLKVEVDAPAEVEGPIERGAKLGAATVFVDGRAAASVPLRAGRAIPAASRFDRVRAFVEDNPLPIAIAVFVILIGGVLLYRRLSGRNDQGERIGVKAK